ncbi:MAG: hypothetical protein RIR52_1418, partial [Acidobacteriota bacterium]
TLSSLPSTSPNEYTGLAFDSQARLLVVNAGNKQILREKTPGSGTFDTILSGGLLSRPRDIVEARDGALYVINPGGETATGAVPSTNHQILKITVSGTTGTATVFLGSAQSGYSGDQLPVGTGTRINIQPEPINISPVSPAVFVRTTVNIILGGNGELIFADAKNNAIRRIR